MNAADFTVFSKAMELVLDHIESALFCDADDDGGAQCFLRLAAGVARVKVPSGVGLHGVFQASRAILADLADVVYAGELSGRPHCYASAHHAVYATFHMLAGIANLSSRATLPTSVLRMNTSQLRAGLEKERERVRVRLEQLPRPSPLPEAGPAVAPATIWWHGPRSYSPDGLTPVTLSVEEDCALTVFKERSGSLDTAGLQKAAGIANASRVMKRLDERFPGAVRLPGRQGKGQGYYAHVRSMPAPASASSTRP